MFDLSEFSWMVSEQVTEEVAGVASSLLYKTHFLHSVHLKESLSLRFPWPSGERKKLGRNLAPGIDQLSMLEKPNWLFDVNFKLTVLLVNCLVLIVVKCLECS